MTTLKAVLIDDEPRGITSMQKLLQINCPDVSGIGSCTNADEAIELIKSMGPDLELTGGQVLILAVRKLQFPNERRKGNLIAVSAKGPDLELSVDLVD
jgi:hypothetical protein